MKQYFELHLTIEEPSDRKQFVETTVEALGWKFSAIDNDIILGDGVKMYATTHMHRDWSPADAVRHLEHGSAELAKSGVNVIRKKLEQVIYDARKGRDF